MTNHELLLTFLGWCGGLSCAGILALYAVRASKAAIGITGLATLLFAVLVWVAGIYG